MRRLPGIAACFFLVSSLAAFGQEWPSFRGPGARGVADGQDLPADWDVKTGRNVRWKTAVPGVGHSSPVVWGDRIFLTTAVPAEPGTLVLGDKGGISLAADKPPISWRLLCLDAPVSGGEAGAQNGTLSIMCGGTKAAFAAAEPVMQADAARMVHIGGPGAG